MDPIKSDEMKTSKRCWVLGVGKPYDFIPDGGTETIKGCKFFYVGTDDITKPHVDEENGSIGYIPQKITMEPAFYDSVKNIPLPCLADITFAIKLETGGAKVRVVGVDFVTTKK